MPSTDPSPIPTPTFGLQIWPELMSAAIAAQFVGERSAKAFRRRVGVIYPQAIHIAGRGKVWAKADLEACIAVLRGRSAPVSDLADVL